MKKQTKQNKPAKEKWEKEFDKKFFYHELAGIQMVNFQISDIKPFIRTLLSAQKQEIVEEVLKIAENTFYPFRKYIKKEKIMSIQDEIIKRLK